MKLLIFFTVVISLQVTAKGYGQKVSLTLKNVQLEEVFKEVKKQTGYTFVYTRAQLNNCLLLTLKVTNIPLKEFLSLCFKNQPLTFIIEGNYVVVQSKNSTEKPKVNADSLISIKGKVVDENGESLDAVTVVSQKTNKISITNKQGEFFLNNILNNDVLVVSSVGYKKIEILVNNQKDFLVKLNFAVGVLDETIVMGYGKTSRRLNTGNIGKVGSDEISKQPVSNILATLSGRIPGLVITQSTGVPGGNFKVQIRGRNSIAQGSEPLYIIDGVPFAANNNNVNQLSSALASYQGQGLSPLNSINPADIESIEVLKDADATAIYGSRGANGVILITTKTGTAGKQRMELSITKGFSKITRSADMLNTQQYISMRREAFKNDDVTPDEYSAPDLLLWDTTRYTDFKKLFIGGTADMLDAHANFSAGTSKTKFLIGGNYHEESTVFPGEFNYKKGSFSINLNHISENKKLIINLKSIYNTDNNFLPLIDFTSLQTLSPNLPNLKDSNGILQWEKNGVSFDNPLAYLRQKYTSKTNNLLSNFQFSYQILSGLISKLSLGYNTNLIEETSFLPKASQNPQTTLGGIAIFGNNKFKSWSVEPQISYDVNILKGKFSVLIGATLQQLLNDRLSIQASGYTNDATLGSIEGASNLIVNDGSTKYKYGAAFGRFNYNLEDKYILNFSGRRDGSSRFGPNNRFANFMAAGGAWIFSNEKDIKDKLKFLSFGKIRTSYGITGNDQIGDYQYLDVWSNFPYQYQTASLIPTRLLNSDYSWEINKKLEAGIELGFLEDFILFSTSYYKNKSDNQLINFRLPSQTGFTSIFKNFPATILNYGWEFTLNGKIISNKKLNWNVAANISLPKNKLLSFPELSTSAYAKAYIIGKSLNTYYGYHLLGVDPTTGVYQFEDVNKDGEIGSDDYVSSYNLDPQFYGGFSNNLNFKGWEFNLFFEFKKQKGFGYNNYPIYNFTPGGMYNLPAYFLDRWQKPGDRVPVQQFTQTYTPAYDGQYNFSSSDGVYGDASYIRLKNASISYSLKNEKLRNLHFDKLKFYIQGQNLFTVTKYKGSDPETQNLFVLPPLRTIITGIQITF